MNRRELIECRQRLAWGQESAARYLGITTFKLDLYESFWPIPKHISLACIAVEWTHIFAYNAIFQPRFNEPLSPSYRGRGYARAAVKKQILSALLEEQRAGWPFSVKFQEGELMRFNSKDWPGLGAIFTVVS